MHNSGRRTLEISGRLRLSKGPGGLRAGPFSVKLGTPLAPSGSRQATVLLGKRFPRGPWRAEMRLESGFIQRVAVATIKFPRYPAVAKPHPAGGGPGGHRRLIGLGAILFALLGIVMLSHFARLRLRPL